MDDNKEECSFPKINSSVPIDAGISLKGYKKISKLFAGKNSPHQYCANTLNYVQSSRISPIRITREKRNCNSSIKFIVKLSINGNIRIPFPVSNRGKTSAIGVMGGFARFQSYVINDLS